MKTIDGILEFAKGLKLKQRFILAALDFNGGNPICRGTLLHPDMNDNIIAYQCWTCPLDKLDVFKKMDLSEIIEAERTRLNQLK